MLSSANELFEESEYNALKKPFPFREASTLAKQFRNDEVSSGAEKFTKENIKAHFDVGFSEENFTVFFVTVRNIGTKNLLIEPELATLLIQDKTFASISTQEMQKEAKKNSFFLNSQEFQLIGESLYRKNLKTTYLRPGEATHGLVWFATKLAKEQKGQLQILIRDLENLGYTYVALNF